MTQRQFLDVVDEDVAHDVFREACAHLTPVTELVPLEDALGRVLDEDVVARIDVPGFDRSNVDGYAVRAVDTYGAEELDPVTLASSPVTLAAGDAPPEDFEAPPATATQIATGGVVPRGTDAIVMVEYTEPVAGGIAVSRSVAPGTNISFAGSDIGRGDTILRRGLVLTSRDTAVLAAIGVANVAVVVRPRVAVLSTGDEIVPPGTEPAIGQVVDSNRPMLLDAIRELGCEPVSAGIAPDDVAVVESIIEDLVTGPAPVDVVLLSGGTSKGEGDINSEAIVQSCRPHPRLSRDRRPRCRPQAGQTNPPVGHCFETRRCSARFPDVCRVHVSRVCRSPSAPPLGYSRGRCPLGASRRSSANHVRPRADGVLARRSRRRQQWAGGISARSGIGQRHGIRTGGRLRSDPGNNRVRGGGCRHHGPPAQRSTADPRSRCHRQSLRWPRLPPRPACRRGVPGEVDSGRFNRRSVRPRPGRGRRRWHPPPRCEDRHVQRAVPSDGGSADTGIRPTSRSRLPSRRSGIHRSRRGRLAQRDPQRPQPHGQSQPGERNPHPHRSTARRPPATGVPSSGQDPQRSCSRVSNNVERTGE